MFLHFCSSCCFLLLIIYLSVLAISTLFLFDEMSPVFREAGILFVRPEAEYNPKRFVFLEGRKQLQDSKNWVL